MTLIDRLEAMPVDPAMAAAFRTTYGFFWVRRVAHSAWFVDGVIVDAAHAAALMEGMWHVSHQGYDY